MLAGLSSKIIKNCNYHKNIEILVLHLSVTPDKMFWEKMVTSNRKREIWSSSNFDKDRWRENTHVPIFMLKDKYDSEFKVAMKFLHLKYKFCKKVLNTSSKYH